MIRLTADIAHENPQPAQHSSRTAMNSAGYAVQSTATASACASLRLPAKPAFSMAAVTRQRERTGRLKPV